MITTLPSGKTIDIHHHDYTMILTPEALTYLDIVALIELYHALISPIPLMTFNPNSQGVDDTIEVICYFTNLDSQFLRSALVEVVELSNSFILTLTDQPDAQHADSKLTRSPDNLVHPSHIKGETCTTRTVTSSLPTSP